MPNDEFIVLERYRGIINNELTYIIGNYPILITDYINCNRIQELEAKKQALKYFLSEQVDIETIKASQFLFSLSGVDTQLVSLSGDYKLAYF